MVKLTIKINMDNLFTHDGIMINTKLLGKIQDLIDFDQYNKIDLKLKKIRL